MKKLWRLALVVTLALPLVMTDVSPSPTSAVGTWVSRSPSAALGIAIRADGEKYMVARGTALWGPMNWGSFVTTNSTPTVFSQSWSALSVATNSSGTHCVAGESGAAITLRYSSNSCASWTQATLVAATTGSVNSVAISDNGQRMFATTSTGAFFASTTASPSFSQRSRTESWTDVATDSLGSVVFATTSDGQILKSTDSGVNFTQVLLVGAISINSVTLSSDGVIAFAGDANGVLRKSVDSGANWAAMTIPNAGGVRIADIATSADGSKVLIALDGGKLLRSTNGGGTWTEEDLVRNWKSVAMSASGVHMGAGTSTNFYTSSLSLDISSSTPADGAVGVLNDANIVLNFNNKLVLGTGKNFYIRRTSDNSIFETIPVGDERINAFTVGRITINPQGTLALATSYYVNTDSGTVTDDHGNEWDSTNQQVRFTTSSTDNVAPTIVSKYPTSTTDRVTTTANISITFNENVRAVAGKFLRVCFSSGTTCSQSSERIAVTDSSRITVTGATVVINPEMEMNVNSTHYVRVEAGAFEDLNGNGFAGIISDGGTSALTTLGVYTLAGDGTAPVFRRACMSLDRTRLHLSYDEQLVAGTLISGQFGVTISGVAQSIQSVVIPEHSAHVTIQMAGAMAIGSSPEISYTRHATSGGIQDSNSNRALSLGSIDASSTSDCVGPLMTTSLPARGATDVSRNANIVVEFDETVQMQYGKQILIRNNTTSTNIETFSTNDTNRVTVSGNVLTIDPTLEFPANAVISLHTIDSGFVEDLSGNDFWGWGSSTYFTFTTGSTTDDAAPDATSTPDLVAGSDTGSSSTDNITNDSTPTISVTAAENGGTVTVRAEKAGVFHICQMSGSTSGATCTLPSLADGVWLITTVHADAIGNTSSRSAARSITIDTAAPTLSSVSPTTDATGVSFSSNIRVTFSETIAKGTGTISLLTGSSCSVLVGLSVRAVSFTSDIARAAGTAETIAVGSSGITTSVSVVTFTPSATLATSTRHCVTYPAGVFTDIAGNNAPAMTLQSTGRVVFTTTGADVTSPSATISSPNSPANSRTLVYAVVFDEAINGLTSSDFSNVGTASCTFAVPTSSGTSFSVTATCTTDGTVIMRLAPNSVTDAALNTGPTSAVLASSVTINTTTPTTAPAGTVVPTQATIPSSGTTVPSVGTGRPAPAAVPAAPVAQGSGTTIAPTTTTSVAPSTTTTTLPSVDVPEVADGGGALVVNGQRIEATITRENNQLVIAAGVLRARISAVQREGGRAPLDAQGRIRMDQGDSIEIEVTGFGTESQVEVRMYSDPVLLGRSTVSALGSLAASYEVPDSVDDGRHTVVLLGESQQGEELTFALAVFIGAESTGPSTLALLVGIPLGLAVIAALIIPAIIRRRRKDEEEK